MYLLIWALKIDSPVFSNNCMWAFNMLTDAIAAANCQIEDAAMEGIKFNTVQDLAFCNKEALFGWQSPEGEILIIIKMEIK